MPSFMNLEIVSNSSNIVFTPSMIITRERIRMTTNEHRGMKPSEKEKERKRDRGGGENVEKVE